VRSWGILGFREDGRPPVNSRLAAIKIVNDTGAVFTTQSELREWLQSPMVADLSAQPDWPTIETKLMRLDFAQQFVPRDDPTWAERKAGQSAARRRAARQRVSRLEAAFREVERLQESKKQGRGDPYVARASTTDPEAHVMRNGEGGTVPSYNVQLVTDTTHGLIVNVEATTDAIDYRQLEPALSRCQETMASLPKQIVADGDYTNHASVKAAEASKVDFYGSWHDSWKPTEYDAHGRSGKFISSEFPYDAEQNVYVCPAGKRLTLHVVKNNERGVRLQIYRAPKAACRCCPLRDECGPKKKGPEWRRSITRGEDPAATAAFKAKMETEEAKAIYRQRSQIAEFPHAWIKERCGLRQFRCRGQEKASMEAIWACLSYNIIRWVSIRRKLDGAALAAA
jgi:hypothetical protein